MLERIQVGDKFQSINGTIIEVTRIDVRFSRLTGGFVPDVTVKLDDGTLTDWNIWDINDMVQSNEIDRYEPVNQAELEKKLAELQEEEYNLRNDLEYYSRIINGVISDSGEQHVLKKLREINDELGEVQLDLLYTKRMMK